MKCFTIERNNGERYNFNNSFESILKLEKLTGGKSKKIILDYINLPNRREELLVQILMAMCEKKISQNEIDIINNEENRKNIIENVLKLVSDLNNDIEKRIEKESKIYMLKNEIKILKKAIEPLLNKVKVSEDAR